LLHGHTNLHATGGASITHDGQEIAKAKTAVVGAEPGAATSMSPHFSFVGKRSNNTGGAAGVRVKMTPPESEAKPEIPAFSAKTYDGAAETQVNDLGSRRPAQGPVGSALTLDVNDAFG